MATGTLIIVRHGQSQANLDNVFAGWVETPLTEKGITQARAAGEAIKKSGFMPDAVFSSTLSRAINTGKHVLAAMGCNKEIIQNAALLERHYGGLTGMNKAQAKEAFGDELFLQYRRSYDVPPPPMDAAHASHPDNAANAPKVIGMPPNGKGTEALIDVVARVTPFWENELLPRLAKGENILIAAHGNSLRALSMMIERMTPEQVKSYEIDNGVPIRYDISVDGKSWKASARAVL